MQENLALGPEAFGYCWHRDNGEFYYGIHKGELDDGYTGSGVKFRMKFDNTNRNEWHRTIEFRGDYDECLDWEADMVTQEMVDQPDSLNLKPGGLRGPIMVGPDNPRYGKSNEHLIAFNKSKEFRKRTSERMQGNTIGRKVKHSDEHKAFVATIASMPSVKAALKARFEAGFNPSASPEAKAKISASRKRIMVCPHCKKEGGLAGMMRWHFDNCKHKEEV